MGQVGDPHGTAMKGAAYPNLRMRYLGCLGLLGECAVHVPEDLRESIERAMEDACQSDSALRWRRILNRIEIEAS